MASAALAELQAREEARFVATHPRSRALAERAHSSLFEGVPMHWMRKWPGGFPVVVREAKGARFVDVDGIEYVDFCLGDTGAMTGHAPEPTLRAVTDQSAKGITLMLPSEDALWVSAELSRRFRVSSWQFALTATDANRFTRALRYPPLSVLTRPHLCGRFSARMSVRICLVAILLGIVVLVAGCAGGGDGAPKVTLTDKSCTYSGARTHEPGVFDMEAENTTSHLASFAVYELAPGFSIKDVRGFFQRVMVAHDRGDNNVKPPTPDDFRRNEAWGHADPRATTLLPVNASAGRLVIVCMENLSADTRPSGGVWPTPAAIYVPAQLEIR